MATSTRIWVGGCAGAALLIAAGGWFLGVQPQLDHAAQADASIPALDAQVGAVQTRVAALSKVAAKQGELEAEAVTLTKSVPATLQANTFIRRMNTIAALDAVNVQSVTVGSATAYTQPAAIAAKAAAAAAAAAPAATPAPGASASASASTAPVAAAPAAPVLAAADPSITGANFTVIPMTVVIKGTGSAGLQFVKDVQRDERLFLVTSVTTSADQDDPSAVTTTLAGSVYAVEG